MLVLRAALLTGWLVIACVSVKAVMTLGLEAGMTTASADMEHPWRAQYNIDLLLHLLLAGAWMLYRETRWWMRAVCLVGAVAGGAAFTYAYILVATFRARGDVRTLLLGERAAAA